MQPIQNRSDNNSSKTNENGPRRGSASALTHRPPLPSNIGNRSQSLDELLDANEINSDENDNTAITEGASEIKNTYPQSHPSTKIIVSDESDYRSKSLDDLLSERDNNDYEIDDNEQSKREERSKSVDILADKNAPKQDDHIDNGSRLNRPTDTNSIGSTSSLNNAINRAPNLSDDNNFLNQDDAKSYSTTNSQAESLGSQNSEKKRTLLNKCLKKVKSLMKK